MISLTSSNKCPQTDDTADESEVKEVDVSATAKKKKAPKKKKTEISL